MGAQRSLSVSVEGGGLYQRFTGNLESETGPGVGYEAQVRVTSQFWSLGGGIDYFQHERTYATFGGSQPVLVIQSADANFVGAFIEPRLALAAPDRVVRPYVMLRAGLARATPEVNVGSGTEQTLVEAPVNALTWNGGLGVAVRIVGTLTADLGVSGGLVRWRSHDDRVFEGETVGNGDSSTGNFVARLGLSFGVVRLR
jgi:hypothetical protein